MLSFGFAPILVRVAGDTSPFLLAAFRTGFAVAILLPYWFYMNAGKGGGDSRLSLTLPADVKTFSITALAGISLGLHFTFWIASLSFTSVASASVLVTIHPVMLILVESLLFKRDFSLSVWMGVILAFLGSILLGITDQQVMQSFQHPLMGNSLAFTAAAIFVVYILIGERIRQKMEWINYVFNVYLFAALTCIVLNFAWLGFNLSDIDMIGVAAGFGLALGPQVLGHGSMNYAVKYISPTYISTLVLAEPVIASILAYFLFEELPPLPSILAMVIVLAGVILTWKRKVRK